ncbi:MAG: class I SAM-dependent methyltransferase, partial [Polyangiaceae bacterium]
MLLDHANFATFERAGYHVTRVHFYAPIPEVRNLDGRRRYDAIGLDMNDAGQQALLGAAAKYFDEYEWASNAYFGPSDSRLLYGILRHVAPTRIVEVGSGFSTRVIRAALQRNGAGELVTIEPYEPERMPIVPTYPVPVQHVPLDIFTGLGQNDVLFVDSSHVAKTGSDVTHLVLNVLPALKPGVIVHFHDIF